MANLARSSWYSRTGAQVGAMWRSVRTRITSALRSSPNRPGMTSGRVATPNTAEADLRAMATSPAAYAALLRSALSFATYPIRVYWGHPMGGLRSVPLDPEEVPWAGSLLRLLQTPDPATAGALFPRPGEGLIMQIVADLKATGVFVVVPVETDAGDIIGLHRLHPGCCTIERYNGFEELVYRNGSDVRRYPLDSVSLGRLLSWSRGGQGELGVGAATPLRHLIDAEAAALEQTANTVRQGGSDVTLEGTNPNGAAFLSNERNRRTLVAEVTAQLATPGRRVTAMGPDVAMKDNGLKPADLRAPEMLKAAQSAELMALQVVPVAVGAGEGTYATAVQQYRVQAEMDEGVNVVISSYLLRPLARRFALRAGGLWAQRLDMIDARIDLSTHPGYGYLRTDAVRRMEGLVRLGYTTQQAADAENMDLPPPAGTVMLNGSPAQPGPEEGSHKDPRNPVGDGDGPQTGEPTRGGTVLQLLAR